MEIEVAGAILAMAPVSKLSILLEAERFLPIEIAPVTAAPVHTFEIHVLNF